MKIFFVVMGSAIIISGAVVSLVMLVSRQFVLFQAWDIAFVFVLSLLVSVIPFSIAAILARLEKVERLQKDDYNLLENKISALQKTTKNIKEELSDDAKAHKMLLEGTATAKSDGTVPAGTIDEFFQAVRGEPSPPAPPTPSAILPYTPPVAQTQPVSPAVPAPPAPVTYKGMLLSKIIRIALLCLGIICLALSGFYLFQLIFHGLWYDTNIRIPQLIQFFGGVVFMVLSRILKNQEKIIRLSLKRRKENGVKNDFL